MRLGSRFGNTIDDGFHKHGLINIKQIIRRKVEIGTFRFSLQAGGSLCSRVSDVADDGLTLSSIGSFPAREQNHYKVFKIHIMVKEKDPRCPLATKELEACASRVWYL